MDAVGAITNRPHIIVGAIVNRPQDMDDASGRAITNRPYYVFMYYET